MRPRVLIVDDDVPTVSALKRMLKPSFECEGFADPEAASNWLRDASFDLALLDVLMPRIDGFELLRQVKHVKPGTPVVMLSGDARPDTIITAMRRGACDFVVKPFEDAKGIASRLNDVLLHSMRPRPLDALLAQLEDDRKPLPRYSDARQLVMNEFQRAYLERLMRDAGGNLSAASRLSGIDRANLRRALQKVKKGK